LVRKKKINKERKEPPFTKLLWSGLENDQLSGKFALESRSARGNAVKALQKKSPCFSNRESKDD
jgi:hypothetical protein